MENRGRSAGFGFAAFHNESDMRQACQRLARKNVCGRDLFVIEDNDLSQLEKLKQEKVIIILSKINGRLSLFRGSVVVVAAIAVGHLIEEMISAVVAEIVNDKITLGNLSLLMAYQLDLYLD